MEVQSFSLQKLEQKDSAERSKFLTDAVKVSGSGLLSRHRNLPGPGGNSPDPQLLSGDRGQGSLLSSTEDPVVLLPPSPCS